MTKAQCLSQLESLYQELVYLCDAELDHNDYERIAQMVEQANHDAARFVEIESEPVYLTPRQGLVIVGRLLSQIQESEPASLLSVDQVGAMMGVSASTVYRLADGGKLPKPVKIGALVRWNRAEIEGWIAAGCKSVRLRKVS